MTSLVARSSRPRRLAAFTALTVVTALGATGLTSAASASVRPAAPSASSEFLFVPTTAVTTSTGHKLTVGVGALATSFGSSDSFTSVQVTVGRAALESHTWSFNLTTGSPLTANAKAGTATLVTGSAFGSFGSLTLKATSAGTAKTTKCGGVTTTTHPVTITGTIDFKTKSTGSHAWGNVGSATKKFTIRRGSITGTSGSVGGVTNCGASVCPGTGVEFSNAASNSNPDATFVLGIQDGHSVLTSIARNVTLNSTTSREDLVYAKSTATARHASSGESLTVKPKQSTITGSAVLRQKTKPATSKCKKTKTVAYNKASLTSKKLVGHAQVFGNLAVTSSAKGNDFSITTKA